MGEAVVGMAWCNGFLVEVKTVQVLIVARSRFRISLGLDRSMSGGVELSSLASKLGLVELECRTEMDELWTHGSCQGRWHRGRTSRRRVRVQRQLVAELVVIRLALVAGIGIDKPSIVCYGQ